MDRDLATKLVDTMGDIKTALETIATNTTPATPEADANAKALAEETVTEVPEEAPATTRKGGK